MKNVRKLMIFALIALVLVCAGCGKDAEQPTTLPGTEPTVSTTEATQAPTEITVPEEETVSEIFLFPEQTEILGVNVGGMEVDVAIQEVNKVVSGYAIDATVNDKSFQIAAEDVNLTVSEESIQQYAQALADGTVATEPVAEYDNSLLKKQIAERCQVALADADVSYNASKNAFEVTKERSSVSINVQAAADKIGEAMKTLQLECKVSVKQEMQKPEVLSSDPRLINGAKKANEYLTISLTYVYTPDNAASKKQTVTPDDIGGMISFNEDYEPYVNESLVKRYANEMNEEHGVRVQFKITGGGYISVKGTDITQAVDVDALAADLYNCLVNRISGTRNAVYKAATEVETVWEGNYVEIDLSRQHLWVYENGVCVVSTPIVSGSVAGGMKTPTGVYSIYSKSRGATLVGPGYATPVSYWMPFYRGYGLHDANWRSKFGGDEYLYNGSHGCVNIPPAAAAQVYEHTSVGTKVILYGGVSSVKLEDRKFTGTTEYSLTTGTNPFQLDIATEDAPALTYTSDAPDVVEVAEDGTVTVKGAGTANITVSAPAHGKYKSGTVTVKITVEDTCPDGHDYVWTTVEEPTCAAGKEQGVCSVCGNKQEKEIPPVDDHTYGQWVTETEPGCEESGKKVHTCEVCGKVESETIPSTGHDFGSGDVCANGCGATKPTEPETEPTEPETEATESTEE